MKRAAQAVASEPAVQEAARAYLQAGGDAIGAVVAGFFAAAGQDAGVLLGPIGLLSAQVGGGVRAFDGRTRQPGLEARRPRGLNPEDVAPTAARAAAPTSIAALLVALRYSPQLGIAKVLAPGIVLAKEHGCERRAAVLEQIQRLGAAALAAPAISRALIHVAGPSEGGALGIADLAAIPELDHPARSSENWRVAPWEQELPDPERMPDFDWTGQLERQQGICAHDLRGGVAALCYDRVSRGLEVAELELLLPLNAVPPRRGVSRIAPGSFLPAPTPLVIELSSAAVPLSASVRLHERTPLSVHVPVALS
jgi:gamma-glutamyltranspeptidase/glutathione hydrolase